MASGVNGTAGSFGESEILSTKNQRTGNPLGNFKWRPENQDESPWWVLTNDQARKPCWKVCPRLHQSYHDISDDYKMVVKAPKSFTGLFTFNTKNTKSVFLY